ncbi:MAG: BTAD domain-containing putative transcriptional regulator [Anaerolineae bacterium]|jgi:DNA-binding SARP family transcriptional activator
MRNPPHTGTPTGGVAVLRIQTLGGFRVWRDGVEIEPGAWRREKALHLFQFLVTARGKYLHKEQIIDRLWPELDGETGDRDFRVALNAVNKAIEPERRPRAEPRFIRRYGLTYGLNVEEIEVDADDFEDQVTAGNRALPNEAETAIAHYQSALALYGGSYLPERRYEDWISAERERLQLLVLTTMATLAELMLERSPPESIRLAQLVLTIDPVWESAYRVQMRAYIAQGNRPLALRTYRQCRRVLEEEFGVDPLPETKALYRRITDQERG